MEKDGFGVFQIFLPNNPDGTLAIPHGSRVKIHLQVPGRSDARQRCDRCVRPFCSRNCSSLTCTRISQGAGRGLDRPHSGVDQVRRAGSGRDSLQWWVAARHSPAPEQLLVRLWCAYLAGIVMLREFLTPRQCETSGVYYDPPPEETHVFEHARPKTPKVGMS